MKNKRELKTEKLDLRIRHSLKEEIRIAAKHAGIPVARWVTNIISEKLDSK